MFASKDFQLHFHLQSIALELNYWKFLNVNVFTLKSLIQYIAVLISIPSIPYYATNKNDIIPIIQSPNQSPAVRLPTLHHSQPQQGLLGSLEFNQVRRSLKEFILVDQDRLER